jgi:hypothetical protein
MAIYRSLGYDHWQFQVTAHAIVVKWRDWGKPRKVSVWPVPSRDRKRMHVTCINTYDQTLLFTAWHIVIRIFITTMPLRCLYTYRSDSKKVKQSLYTPWRRLGGEEYSPYSFTTSALDGGEWSASRPGRALPKGKGPPVPIVQEAGWTPEPGHRG